MPTVQLPGDIGISDDGSRLLTASAGALAKQRLLSAHETGLTSWRYDLSKGFPYRELFEGDTDPKRIQILYTKWLSSFDFVETVDRVNVAVDGGERLATIDWMITVNGESVSGTVTV